MEFWLHVCFFSYIQNALFTLKVHCTVKIKSPNRICGIGEYFTMVHLMPETEIKPENEA